MGIEVRSIRYFDGLFMKAEEFIQEQNYHTRMRRLHNRYLHSSGIVWGLEIQKSKKPGANPADVTITQGMALNIMEENGEEVSKEIILTDDTDVSLSSYGAGKTAYIYISYSREPAPKDSEDSKNIHWLEEGKLVSGTDRGKINEDENVLLGKVSLINANGTVTVDKIDYEESGVSLRKYAGFSGKSLQAEKIILAINGVTSGFASIEGKQIGISNGIQVNSPITSFIGALSIGDKLGVGGNVQLPDNKSLVLGTTNPVSLHNNNAAPELWLEATGQASSALAIGTAFDLDKQVKFKYTPGTVGAASGELLIGQDAKSVGTFTHGTTSLLTNGIKRLTIDATGNITILTGNLKITNNDTFLDFGSDTRQMINLWGNGPNAAYGIGVQGWTQYYRSAGNFVWYVGGTHSDVELDPGAGGSAALIIKRGSGNVGIGTANPLQKLSIKGLESSAHGTGAAIGISNAAPGGANWYLRAGATGTSTPESGFSIADDSAYRLVIDKSGNIGIGITNPQNKLDVTGGDIQWGNHSWLGADQGGSIELGGDSTTPGKGTPYIDFHFKGLTQDFNTRIINDDNGRLFLQANTLYTSGNVGIGTAGPADKLDVAGNLRVLTGSNPIRFTAGWTGFPDAATNQAEISNDTGSYKTLMIVGNKSGGLGRRVSVWDRLEVNGSQKITGRLGTNGYDPDSGYPAGWGGGIHTWDIAAHGTGKAVSGWQSGNWDLAEKFEKYDESLEPGDVVVADTSSSERLIKSTSPYQDNLLGVISEKPGFLLGVNWEDPQYPTALALAGRVKVRINMEGGPIREGDYLTSSSEESYAMKANRPGRVIGIALESFDGSQGSKGKVVVFVNPHWWGGYSRRNT